MFGHTLMIDSALCAVCLSMIVDPRCVARVEDPEGKEWDVNIDILPALLNGLRSGAYVKPTVNRQRIALLATTMVRGTYVCGFHTDASPWPAYKPGQRR